MRIINIMVKTIKQTVIIDANPKEVYNTLMDSKKHSQFTGDKAIISKKVGGSFSVFSGYITGKNKELAPAKRIVQEWTTTELPKGYYTEVTYLLKEVGEKTKIEFTQTNVPDDNYKSLSEGWEEYYWTPLKKMLEHQK